RRPEGWIPSSSPFHSSGDARKRRAIVPYTVCVGIVRRVFGKLDGPLRGQVHPGLNWQDAVRARPSSRERTWPLSWVPESGWPLPLSKPIGWQNGGKMLQKGGKIEQHATYAKNTATLYDVSNCVKHCPRHAYKYN